MQRSSALGGLMLLLTACGSRADLTGLDRSDTGERLPDDQGFTDDQLPDGYGLPQSGAAPLPGQVTPSDPVIRPNGPTRARGTPQSQTTPPSGGVVGQTAPQPVTGSAPMPPQAVQDPATTPAQPDDPVAVAPDGTPSEPTEPPSEPMSDGPVLGAGPGVPIGAPVPPGVVVVGPDGTPVELPLGDPTPEPLPPASTPGNTGAALDTIVEIREESAELLCQCELNQFGEEMPFPPGFEEECSTYRLGGSEPPPVTECIHGILVSTSAGDDAVECQLAAHERMLDCLASVGCDLERTYRCENYLWQDMAACPQYPYDLDARIQAECWGNAVPAPFVCDDGTRVSQYTVCDGRQQCPGGEDESDQYCPYIGELPNDFPEEFVGCDTYGAFHVSEYCDGYVSCVDGTDEDAETCLALGLDVFVCANGRGLPQEYVCDGVPDCRDGGDDEGVICQSSR